MKIAATAVKNYLPGLVREFNAAHNRVWKYKGEEFATLQDVINKFGNHFDALKPFVQTHVQTPEIFIEAHPLDIGVIGRAVLGVEVIASTLFDTKDGVWLGMLRPDFIDIYTKRCPNGFKLISQASDEEINLAMQRYVEWKKEQ